MPTDDAPETWDAMKARHAQEKAKLVTDLREDGLTQAQAARVLEMDPRALHNYLLRNSIQWTAPRRGFRQG